MAGKYEKDSSRYKGDTNEWYCRPCQKLCGDKEAFKSHIISEYHERRLISSANKEIGSNDLAEEFTDRHLKLRDQFNTKQVNANIMNQDYIANRDHLHMNSAAFAAQNTKDRNAKRDKDEQKTERVKKEPTSTAERKRFPEFKRESSEETVVISYKKPTEALSMRDSDLHRKEHRFKPKTQVGQEFPEGSEEFSKIQNIAKNTSEQLSFDGNIMMKVTEDSRLCTKINTSQLHALADFLKENPGIIMKTKTSREEKTKNQRRWEAVAPYLNNLGSVTKDGSGWMMYWSTKRNRLFNKLERNNWSLQDILSEHTPAVGQLLRLIYMENKRLNKSDYDPRQNAEQAEIECTPSKTMLVEVAKAINNAVTATRRHEEVVLPLFDPEKNDNGAEAWCKSIEKLSAENRWSSNQLAAKAGQALRGSALTWFETWEPDVERSWKALRKDLVDLFPEKKNLCERLTKAVLYNSDSADTYCEFARKKLWLLRSTKIAFTDLQLFELIRGGISDAQLRTSSLNSSVGTMAELFSLLSTYKKVSRKRSSDVTEITTTKRSSTFFRDSDHATKRYDSNNEDTFDTGGERGHDTAGSQKNRDDFTNKGSRHSRYLPTKFVRKKEDYRSKMYFNCCKICNKRGHSTSRCFYRK